MSSTTSDLKNFMSWTNTDDKYSGVIDKINKMGNKPRVSYTLHTIQEENEEGQMEEVLDRLDEKNLSKNAFLDFLNKHNYKGKFDEMIHFLENNQEAGLTDILAKARELNEDGIYDDFIHYINMGGVDPRDLIGNDEEEIYKLLVKGKMLDKNQDLFDMLSKRSDMRDPEKLLDKLKKAIGTAGNRSGEGEDSMLMSLPNKDQISQGFGTQEGKLDRLINELEKFKKDNWVFPDFGENNRDHPFTKILHRKLKACLFKLRDNAKQRRKAERLFGIVFDREHLINKLAAFWRLRHVAGEEQFTETTNKNSVGILLSYLKGGEKGQLMGAFRTLVDGHRNRKNLTKSMFEKLFERSNQLKATTLMKLMGHKTSDKYKKHVTKSYKEKFWGMIIRSMNPGVYKAYIHLKRFKDSSIAKEIEGNLAKSKLVRMLMRNNKARQQHALGLLVQNMNHKKAISKAKKYLQKMLSNKANLRLKESLEKLRLTTRENITQEVNNVEKVVGVFNRANLRVQNAKQSIIKDMHKTSLKLALREESNNRILERLFTRGASSNEEAKRRVLRHLRDLNDKEKVKESKIWVWGKLNREKGREAMMKALCELRYFNDQEMLKMSMNSLFKWKIANLNAKNETMREIEELMNFHRGAKLSRMVNVQERLMRDTLSKLRQFSSLSKNSVQRILHRLLSSTTMKKVEALHKLRNLSKDFNDEEKSSKTLMLKMLRMLSDKRTLAFQNLRDFARKMKQQRQEASRRLKEGLSRTRVKVMAGTLRTLSKDNEQAKRRAEILRKLVNHFGNKAKSKFIGKWSDIVKREKLCKFNGKITGMILSLRKNHKHEMRSVFSKWSQKKMKVKYQRMATFLNAAKENQKRETYVHMKILFMQKKFSTMCKILGRFLEFVEKRKRENTLYAFDAMCLDNPWAEKVPKLLACSRVMSAQMCFWKLKLTRHQYAKKRRQRGGGYKIDKLKFTQLERIFTKKMSQYFMQIQIGKRNKYL